ncbi:MAG TPA: hemagglutination protein [Raoultella sp.]|nr:VENN motif pre-toxin domain-containing protein [Raoultella terrigena]QIT30122.1 hemagglutination protein [Raoultella terrigena]HCR58846.1 hemagglutination protein [Raoultella sp.]
MAAANDINITGAKVKTGGDLAMGGGNNINIAANQKADSTSPIFDKEKEQKRLKEIGMISDIGGQVADIARTQGELSAIKTAKERMNSVTPEDRDAAKTQWEKANPGKTPKPEDISNQIYQNYYNEAFNATGIGSGGAVQRGIQAATAALQGLAGGNIAGALAGASAPELANFIGHNAGINDNDAAKAIAHAILGGVTAALQGNNAAAGAEGGASGELIAGAIAKVLYPDVKDLSKLTEDQKQTLSTLASISSGMAGAIVGGNTAGAATGAVAGKNAVENNSLAGDQARETAKKAAESLKNQVRETLGEGATSAIANGIINALTDTGDSALGGVDYAAVAAMALAACAAGDSYCSRAMSDLAGKNQAVADSVEALMSSDTWSAISDTVKQASTGDQAALEATGGMLAGIILPGKKIPAVGKLVDPTIKIATGNTVGAFEASLSRLPPGERVALVKETVNKVVVEQGMVKDNKLTKLNNRDVYRGADGNLYALDTQHGRFEVVSSKGKYLGEVDFPMQVRKPADPSGGHNLKVR